MGRCYVQENGYPETKGGAKMATPSKKNKGRTLRRAKYLILGSVMLTILIPQYVLAQEKCHTGIFILQQSQEFILRKQ